MGAGTPTMPFPMLSVMSSSGHNSHDHRSLKHVLLRGAAHVPLASAKSEIKHDVAISEQNDD